MGLIKTIIFIAISLVLFNQGLYISKTHEIKLVDSIATLNISLPAHFDTLLIREKSSDHSCGNEYYYRSQNKNHSYELERAPLQKGCIRTCRQFTITHLVQPECGRADLFDPYKWALDKHTLYYEQDTLTRFFHKGVIQIAGLKFGIVSLERFGESHEQKLMYATSIKGRVIEFEFYSTVTDDKMFLSDMQEAFNTIKISL